MIDVDGHLAELAPLLEDYVLDYAQKIGGGNAVEAGLHQPNTFRDGTSSLRWKSTDGEVTIVSGPDRFSQEGTAQGSVTARLVALADNPLRDRGEVTLQGTWSCDGRRVRDTLGN